MQRFVFGAVLATSALASGIPADERAELVADLAAWREKFGADAAANGLLPKAPGGVHEEASDLLLSRLRAAKARLPALRAANPDATFSVLTPFALLSHDEFKARLGRSFGKVQPKRALRVEDVDFASLEGVAAAGSVDWTTGKCVNAVKDQGQCGSCWTFSATGAAESAHCLATGTLLNLSEQQLVSCDATDGDGCNGGWEDKALTWISSHGQCLTKDYPYTSGTSGQNGTCKKTCKAQKLSIGTTVEIAGEGPLTTALNTQPVTVAVEAGNDVWQYYGGGVVTACPGAQSDHAVIAVGYGSASGKNYFKVRNSWGASWGEAGYIRLQRGVGGKGMCNVAEQPAYPKIVKQ
ncbi:cysteine protease family C01A [Achlya hypogyna]|uniref:Cysteine protease family C01A n=1 Tax=Achlya hypogyna TaxID=1202772 RepID=A0A0A7CMY9_ACHHY|nr:secreted protein [Achlya hypogyna]OQR93125.1 cysteine protease family C01A [Achlya hypogyna]